MRATCVISDPAGMEARYVAPVLNFNKEKETPNQFFLLQNILPKESKAMSRFPQRTSPSISFDSETNDTYLCKYEEFE